MARSPAQQLVSRFEWLRSEFDVLQLDGADVRPQPLRVRRHLLEVAIERAPALILLVRRLADDGLKAWREVAEHGYEGTWQRTRSPPTWADGRSSG